MKKAFIAFLLIVCAASLCRAAGGADYGRGAETDPVASALVTTVSGRVSVVENRSNMWNTASVNGSNWVNHAAAMVASVTNVLITADSKTNTIVVERGSIKSWSITE